MAEAREAATSAEALTSSSGSSNLSAASVEAIVQNDVATTNRFLASASAEMITQSIATRNVSYLTVEVLTPARPQYVGWGFLAR